MGYFLTPIFFPRISTSKISAQPESNQRPRDINCKQLQSPALPTELYADLVEKKVLPGLEPGLQGSKPWVLTNYTIEPQLRTNPGTTVLNPNLDLTDVTFEGGCRWTSNFAGRLLRDTNSGSESLSVSFGVYAASKNGTTRESNPGQSPPQKPK